MVEKLKKNVENLHATIQIAGEKAKELAAILEKEQLPDTTLLNKFVELLQKAGNIESGIIADFSKLEKSTSIPKSTIAGYNDRLNKISIKYELKPLLETLDKFTKIYSDNSTFDEPLNEYRGKAAQIINELKTVTDPEKFIEIKKQTDFYIAFVELIEKGNITVTDPQMKIVSEEIESSNNSGNYAISHGLLNSKYQFRQVKTGKITDVTENGIVIVSNKKIRIEPDIFKKHLEKISAYPGQIISCAQWLIFFTAKDFLRLIKHFPHEMLPEEEYLASFEALINYGYLTSFKLSDQDITRYVINSDLKVKLPNSVIWDILKKSGRCVQPAMKGSNISIFTATKEDVFSIDERNKAFLDTIEYIGNNCGKEMAWDKIITLLKCNSYCYYTGENGLVLLSKTMLQSLGVNKSESQLAAFIQKNPNLTLLLSDVDTMEEAKALVESCLPERKYLLLSQFCNIEPAQEKPAPEKSVQEKLEQEKPVPEQIAPEKVVPVKKVIEKTVTKPEQINDENLQTPEEIAKCLAEINIQDDESRFYKLCDRLEISLAASSVKNEENEPESIAQLLVFIFSLAFSHSKNTESSYQKNAKKKEEYHQKSIRYQLATGLIFDDIHFDSATLGEAFPDNKDIHLKIAAFIRAMFSPDSERDYDLYTLGDQLADQIENYPPSLKKILKTLFDLRNTERGFTPAILHKFADQTTIQKKGREIAQEAAALKNSPNLKKVNPILKKLIDRCFGQKSDIYAILGFIEKNDLNSSELIQDMLEKLDDQNKIERYIDDCWDEVKDSKKFPKLENYCRQPVVNHLKKQSALMKEYLDYSGSEKVSISSDIKKSYDALLKEIPVAITSISGDQSGNSVIINALEYVNEAIKTGEVSSLTWAFKEFLFSPYVELDEGNKPEFKSFFESLPGMEAWRCVARHIAEPRFSLSVVLKQITNSGDNYYFDNISHGKKIEEYLISIGQTNVNGRFPWDDNKEGAIEHCAEHEEKLFAEMELALAYGRIEEQVKECIIKLEGQFNEHFHNSMNYGRFRYVFSMFRKLLEKEKNIIEIKLQKRFNSSLAKQKTEKGSPLAKEIEKLLEKGIFNVAEIYMNDLDSGEHELPSYHVSDEKDFFGDFLNKWEELDRLCQKNKGAPIKSWGPVSIAMNPEPGQRESSRNLMANWLTTRQEVNGSTIKNFFEEIGFTVEKADKNKSEPHLVFALTIKPPDINQHDYPHPIAAFGTKIPQPLYVLCLFEHHSVSDLIRIIVHDLHLGNNVIVLYNFASPLEARRKMIEIFRNTSRQNSFLFIDQVLVLYLATLEKVDRMSAMLKTTLAYSYCQPFNPGSGAIPDEMFFGRKKELESILSDNGTNIVYGGRQLGKTALLMRAKSIAHKPDDKRHAVYVEVKGKSPDQAVRLVYEQMKQAKIQIVIPNIDSWEVLCNRIQEFFRDRKLNKLLLLIDEADTFLETDGKNDFKVVRLLIGLSLQTKNGFRFVFAGLHDVARSKNALERNGDFAHMPDPVCIHPLSPMDANNLLKWPLSYLGFRKDHLQDISRILANTNYYPGILHFFGHELIKTVLTENYSKYYNAEIHPPYDLTDNELRKIFASNELNKQIKKKIDLSLTLDPRYKLLANVIALQYYEDLQNEEDKSKGYTSKTIYDSSLELGIESNENFTSEVVKNLLSEMADMGILWKNSDETLFRLRRNSFLASIASSDEEAINNIIKFPHYESNDE